MQRELRCSNRIPLEVPVHVRWKTRSGAQREADGKTGNISGTGVFVALPIRLQRETAITFRLLLPQEVTRIPIELLGEGRVVRRSGPGEALGVAAIIDDYRLSPVGASRAKRGEVSPVRGNGRRP